MAMFGTLRREERIGLGIAAALHAALVVAFLLQPDTREAIEPTQRMTVNLASEVGLEASAPEPVAESRASIAPTIADEPAPAPQPAEAVAPPEPQPVPQPRLERPVEAARPAPTRPSQPDTRQRRRPDTPAAARPQPAAARPQPAAAKAGGGSRVGDNFLAGMGDSTRTNETRAPAAKLGASERASLIQGLAQKIKPHWQPPSGPDVAQITTYLRFRLNRDGSLDGRPTVIRQTGVTDTNRAQAGRHAEQAIRAVQLGAPFNNLPTDYYDAWKLVSPFSFDWKLAQ